MKWLKDCASEDDLLYATTEGVGMPRTMQNNKIMRPIGAESAGIQKLSNFEQPPHRAKTRVLLFGQQISGRSSFHHRIRQAVQFPAICLTMTVLLRI
jgi:hypothetical protein